MRALYRRKPEQDMTLADSVLVGGIVIIGLTEAVHLWAVVLGQPFSACVRVFLCGLAVLLLAAILLIATEKLRQRRNPAYAREVEKMRVRKAMTKSRPESTGRILYTIFGVMVLLQLIGLPGRQESYLIGDMTVETVNTMLATDTIYRFNPMTGQPYVLGMPTRLKLLCLPTLYAILCELFGMNASYLVWRVVPVLVLLGSYLAFATVAKALFPAGHKQRALFLVLVALLMWVGTNAYGMDGFGLQYTAWRGVSLRAGILLPYTFGLLLRKRWRPVPLCVLAEACIVWTLYGMGACLVVTSGMLGIGFLLKKSQRAGRLTDDGTDK